MDETGAYYTEWSKPETKTPIQYAAAAAAKSLQSCLTLCNPIDSSPPGSPIRGILQARKLEWVAISFSNAWKWKVKVKLLSLTRLLATPWTAAHLRDRESPVPGILQARTLEWVAISFSNAWKGKVKVKSLSCVWLLVTSWTAAYQAPPSMGFSRQEYWSGMPLPSPSTIKCPTRGYQIINKIRIYLVSELNV